MYNANVPNIRYFTFSKYILMLTSNSCDDLYIQKEGMSKLLLGKGVQEEILNAQYSHSASIHLNKLATQNKGIFK
jgi:hypothetical protein